MSLARRRQLNIARSFDSPHKHHILIVYIGILLC